MPFVKQKTQTLRLLDYMDSPDGWGNAAGRAVHERLNRVVEQHPQLVMFRISLTGVRRVDVSFARESVIELAKRYRGIKGFCLVDVGGEADVDTDDLLDNWRLAAEDRKQPLTVWIGSDARLVGPKPSQPANELLDFVYRHRTVATPEAAKALRKEVNNVSTRLKQLTDRGFILRTEVVSPSGGVEYRYLAIG